MLSGSFTRASFLEIQSVKERDCDFPIGELQYLFPHLNYLGCPITTMSPKATSMFTLATHFGDQVPVTCCYRAKKIVRLLDFSSNTVEVTYHEVIEY